MNCPKCTDQKLRKSGFDAPFDCFTCGGMWLAHADLPDFFDHLQSSSDSETGHSLNDDKTGLCPAGHGIMLRARIDAEEPFFLEKCGTCGGIWFDHGEWHRIVNAHLADRIHEIWCRAWQIQQQKDKSRQTYLDSNKKLLGSELFERLMKLSEDLKAHPEKGRAIALLQQELYR